MRRVLGLIVLFIAAIAPVVAATNVPDLTWLVGGVYDGGDADEILSLVWDQTPAVTADPVAFEPSISARLELGAPPTFAAPSSASSSDSRAPPLV
jgi:hypothetical protein